VIDSLLGSNQDESGVWGINDEFNPARTARYENDENTGSTWWLRSPGTSSNCNAAYVDLSGRINIRGRIVSEGNPSSFDYDDNIDEILRSLSSSTTTVNIDRHCGVRPALWLELEK